MATVEDLRRQFGTLHDAIVVQTDIRYARRTGITAVVQMVGRDIAQGDPFDNPVWLGITLTMRRCAEYRLSQWPHDNVSILQAHIQESDGEFWIVLDASLFDEGVHLDPDECRQSSFYFRSSELDIEVGSQSSVPQE